VAPHLIARPPKAENVATRLTLDTDAVVMPPPYHRDQEALREATIRPSVRLSVCLFHARSSKLCILELWSLQNYGKPHAAWKSTSPVSVATGERQRSRRAELGRWAAVVVSKETQF